MVRLLARNWWVLTIRGVLAILFGIATFFLPGLTLATLALMFGAFAIVDGAFAIASAITGRTGGMPWWALLVEGLLGIAAGALTIVWPGITLLTFLYLIAAWAIATGIFEIVAAIRLRKEIEGEWALGLCGVASIVLGLALGGAPLQGLVVIAWIIGVYAIAFGAFLLSLSFRLRKFSRALHAHADRSAVS